MGFYLIVFALTVALGATVSARDQADSANSGRTSVEVNTLLRRLQSPNWRDRMRALHALVAEDPSATLLADPDVRAVLIRLLQRESQEVRRGDGRNESTEFQYYEDFLMDVVQKIATKFHDSNAWKTFVYSNYAYDSVFGRWLAKQPQAYPFFFAMVEDKDRTNRSQGLEMLGEVCAVKQGRVPEDYPPPSKQS